MMILSVSLERSRRDEFNDTKKYHKWRTKWAIRAGQRCQGSHVFRLLVWPFPVTVSDISWCRWICLVEIFTTIPIMSSLEFWCDFDVFFFSFLLFLLSLLNVVFIKFAIWKNTWYLWHVNCKYHLQFSKLCYFHRYFCVMLFY